jgi:hypothetical protein
MFAVKEKKMPTGNGNESYARGAVSLLPCPLPINDCGVFLESSSVAVMLLF